MQKQHKGIEQWSAAYFVLKLYVDCMFRFFFKTTYKGKENIPQDKPVIFAPNHQNALMDALAVLSTSSRQPVFLARADIFKNPTLKKILTFLKIMPVFRIRDGYENLHKNDDTFQKTINVLKNGNGLVILPEGNHGDKKKLRPFKKGIARIALQAAATEEELDVQIIPVGLDYSNYKDVGSELLIRFGHPIAIKPFQSIYQENPAKAHNLLIELVSKRLKDEMINIEENKYYSVYTIILNQYTGIYLQNHGLIENHTNRFDAQKLIIECIDSYKRKNFDNFLLLASDALEYNMLLQRRNLSSETYPMDKRNKWLFAPLAFSLFALSPLHLFAFINNMIPLGVAKYVSSKFKDPQFISSVRFVVGLLVVPISYAIQITLFALIARSLMLALIYTVSLPISAHFFFMYKEWFALFAEWAKELKISIFTPKRFIRLKELHINLTELLNEITQQNEETE